MNNRSLPQFTIKLPCLLAIALAILGQGIAHADPLLDQGLQRMAVEIKKFLQEEGLPTEVIVGDFTAPPRLKASGGVEISRAIGEALKRVGVRVSDDAELQLMGKFKLKQKKQHSQDDFESLALEIETLVLDGDDEELAELPISIFGGVALQIAGQTVDVSPQLSERDRQRTLISQYKQPPTKISGEKTLPSAESRFGVEILVRSGNHLAPRKPRLDSQHRSFVDLRHGEEYLVRLHNDAPFEAAVSLAIDGVDMFVDARDAPKDSRLIIDPHAHIDVPGWYINVNQTKAFQIGGYEESVAARLGKRSNVGTITATFRACWDPSGSRPADELGGIAKGGKATKQGRDITKNYVQLRREFGIVRGVVSVRYDR